MNSGDTKPTSSSDAAVAKQRGPDVDARPNPLNELLDQANLDSVAEAKRQGPSALPIIEGFLKHEDFRVRELAVESAGAIGGAEVSATLAAGLDDSNINVRLAAARELARQPYPGAARAVLERIQTSPDETVREYLVEAAGFLPGEKTVAVLRPLAKATASEKDFIGNSAIYALAKLKDSYGHEVVAKRLASSASAYTRYQALERLCYVADPTFASAAVRLLSDKTDAIRVGSVRRPQMRRVADAAVDALACLMKLTLPFHQSDGAYTDHELSLVRDLVREHDTK
ncbi:hypothetical protein BH11MYX1_BH11MYX1_01920 [soil metagenome]